jgi:hypothetical protein
LQKNKETNYIFFISHLEFTGTFLVNCTLIRYERVKHSYSSYIICLFTIKDTKSIQIKNNFNKTITFTNIEVCIMRKECKIVIEENKNKETKNMLLHLIDFHELLPWKIVQSF